jgi:hypothetical protein
MGYPQITKKSATNQELLERRRQRQVKSLEKRNPALTDLHISHFTFDISHYTLHITNSYQMLGLGQKRSA